MYKLTPVNVFHLVVFMCICMCHSLWFWGWRARLGITSPYPPGDGVELIIARSMGKTVTFHTPHTPSSCSRRTVTAWSSVKLCTLSEAQTRACQVTSRYVTTELPSSVFVYLFGCSNRHVSVIPVVRMPTDTLILTLPYMQWPSFHHVEVVHLTR